MVKLESCLRDRAKYRDGNRNRSSDRITEKHKHRKAGDGIRDKKRPGIERQEQSNGQVRGTGIGTTTTIFSTKETVS